MTTADERWTSQVLPELRAAIAAAVTVDPIAVPEPRRAWPAGRDGARLQCLRSRLPKARHARADAPPDRYQISLLFFWSLSPVQEKLNGVFVLWDGAELWTKNGRRIDAPAGFLHCLPPAVPLVGELFLGYGAAAFRAAVTLSQNRLPEAGRTGLTPGTRHHIWLRVRFVAFDVPGLGTLSYEHRYGLLLQLVGSWGSRLRDGPLRVVRRYGAATVADHFREVVHGWTDWHQRRFPPFGVPKLGPSAQPDTRLRCSYRRITDGWTVDADGPGPDARGAPVCGEGLMLWDPAAPWQERGPHNRATDAILKFKPTVLSTGTVVVEPYVHGYRVDATDTGEVRRTAAPVDDGDRDEGAAYTVGIRWRDVAVGGSVVLRPWVSPRLDARRVLAAFPLHRRVFFTFVWYEREPMYMHALGPLLTPFQAACVQRASAAGTMPTLSLRPVRTRSRGAAGNDSWTPGRGTRGRCMRSTRRTSSGTRFASFTARGETVHCCCHARR
jgi:hypothetical protein